MPSLLLSSMKVYCCLVLRITTADSGGGNNYFEAEPILAQGREKLINTTSFLQPGITQRDFILGWKLWFQLTNLGNGKSI